MMDWLHSLDAEQADLYIVFLFGLGFLHKAWVEADIAYVSGMLTPKGGRSHLGNTFRRKTWSLAALMALIGVVWVIRSWPDYNEPRWAVFLIRVTALIIFVWNQYYCWQMRKALRDRWHMVRSGLPTDSQERML